MATPHSPWVLDTAAASPDTPLASPTPTGPHRALASATLTPTLLATAMAVSAWDPADSSVSPASTLDTAATPPAASPTLSASGPLTPLATATATALSAVLASTPLVSPTATGPHRVPMASVMPMLMPSVLVPVDSSVSPAPTLLSASTTTAMVPSPTLLASALLMPMDTDMPVLDTDTDAESPDITVAVSPTATGLPRALASATLMLMPMVTATPQSWPRATQAGPELLPQDSSPPATDADSARGPLRLTPTPPTTPRGPHRELTV